MSMTKAQIISLRDKLKCGKNFPLRLTTTDHLTIIDESNKMQFTKWDDTNGIVYSFRLINPIDDITPNNSSNAISVTAVSYNDITSMEIVFLPLSELDTFFTSLVSSGCNMSDEYKALIKHTFASILHPDRYQLPPTVIANLLGDDAVNAKDDYYAGKYVESTKETLRYAKQNAEIDEANSNNNG